MINRNPFTTVMIMKIFSSFLCCILSLVIASENNENPVVHSAAGSFCGSMLKSHSGRDVYTFRGIRYAEAPTGRNRFKQTTLAKPHEGIFDATKDGPICPQPDAGSQEMSEDCLRLNVYTTGLPHESHQQNRPVIVFLHPGAFEVSSGASYVYGPQFVLDQDVVFVTINYRLGALGFLSTGDHHAPGNAGLKDQVLALKWVQQNIADFGGNPDSVLLMGHSVGALSGVMHLVSPMSEGLFHRIFTISGITTFHHPLPTNQNELVKKQAELLECPTSTVDGMFDCLYEASPEQYVNTFAKLVDFNGFPFLVWTPVVEQPDCDDNDEVQPFLTGQPEELIAQGKAHFVPYFTGGNRDEFGYFSIPPEEAAQCGDNSLYDEFNDHWEEVAPKRFGYESGTPRSSHISKELRSFYFDDEPLKAGSWRQLANLYADALVIFRTHRFERLMATYSPEPVFYYQDLHESCDTYAKWSNGTRFGVVHYDEIFLKFQVSGRPEHCEEDSEAANVVWTLIANYAKTGEPTPADEKNPFSFKFTPSTEDEPQHLEFINTGKMVSGVIYPERMEIWDELFPMPSADCKEDED